MSLRNWLDNRWLVEHKPSPEEVADLLSVVDRDLQDAVVDRISAGWRLGIAYNAALQLATLALAAEGYRPERQRSHEMAVQSLRYTVGLSQGAIDKLDTVRRKRHLSNYERAGTASQREAEEVYDMAIELRRTVIEWLGGNHPNLLGDLT